MDSEIVQQGDILIGKQRSGKFEGFRFYANKNEPDEATNEQNLTHDDEDLIIAFAERARRFCASANGDFTLGSDGIIRWIGQPVGQLIPAEDILKPNFILFADEQLTRESRDQVMIRLERFVIFHFETALKPLFDIKNADTLTDSTRDLASKLVRSLGILPRRDVAETVKGLDQESRAILRRLGVRFGAFHIYIPAILKPIPVRALTLLWCLKNEDSEQIGLSEILASLTAGRTSLIVDPHYNLKFYHLTGYHILGQRAVRIDILERLANLIRSTLNWNPETEPRPDGAYDGKHFFVTPTMMSILGANEADMEEILKGLGYQSHSISSTELEQILAQQGPSSHESKTESILSEAECVGDYWSILQESEPIEKETSSSFSEEQFCATNNLPEAEPVGNIAKPKHPATKDKVILLWRYHYQHHNRSHKNTQSKRKLHSKYKKPFKKEVNTDTATSSKTVSRGHLSHKHNKPHTKRLDRHSSSAQKRPDPDSPFAKLAALRDRFASDTETPTTSHKNH
ncbi:hypothetical protein [Bartonella sp. F02]|uniref:hypothetical protein n=1 Tax=Bartonella sp. F02 TaxID=2967262 RepID=UPI0022A90C97|nr:hypothetical protein [Bartonella sp. F02]MCZ2328804.1 hypothetical protein [Bartonella sp. F02]